MQLRTDSYSRVSYVTTLASADFKRAFQTADDLVFQLPPARVSQRLRSRVQRLRDADEDKPKPRSLHGAYEGDRNTKRDANERADDNGESDAADHGTSLSCSAMPTMTSPGKVEAEQNSHTDGGDDRLHQLCELLR
jgi:hypothetical protein